MCNGYVSDPVVNLEKGPTHLLMITENNQVKVQRH